MSSFSGRLRAPDGPRRGIVRFSFALLALAAGWMPRSASAGWQLQNGGTSVDLHGVTASHGSNQVAWACGDGGTILHTSNGGANWVQQPSGTTADLYSIAFQELAQAPVIAVGAGGVILRTTDAGSNWQMMTSGTTQTLRSISDFGQVICGDEGTVLRSTDGGVSWLAEHPPTTVRLNCANGLSPWQVIGEGGALLIGSTFLPWQSKDTGTTVELFGTPMFSPNRLIVGDAGTILVGSGTWSFTQVVSGVGTALRSAQYSQNNTQRVYAVGDGGVILKSLDHGATWGRQNSTTGADLTSTFFYLDDQRGWAVGRAGTILRTTDGGGPIVPVAVEIPSGESVALRVVLAPQPAHGTARLRFQLERQSSVRLDVFDLSGRRVLGWSSPHLDAGAQEPTISLRGLPAGAFVYRLSTNSGTTTGKLIAN